MDKAQFKYIKGSVNSGCPADIYFYTDVDYWSVDDFLWEFKRLVEAQVSKINIHINSAGGTCVDGISVFTRVMDCKIPTACYNDGLAASMASIIWAAGEEVYMKDYALLMIHNPFMGDEGNKAYNQVTEAFAKQLKIIYKKRFGLSDEQIEAIMNGEDGNDGTFLTAEQAVENGFITADHVIPTPEAFRGKISAALEVSKGANAIMAVMNKFIKLPSNDVKNKNDNSNINQTNIKMNENEIKVFAALLGMGSDKATVDSVSAQISAIKAKAEKYDTLKASYDKVNKDYSAAQTELQGAKTSVKNLNADLEAAKASLKKYEDAEKEAKAKKIENLVEQAVNDCKIDKNDKETWIKMAENDFDLAKNVLNKIPGRANINAALANEGKNDANENLKNVEEEIKAKVEAVTGKDFHFRKLD